MVIKLKHLAKNIDLNNPQAFLEYMNKKSWKNSTKYTYSVTYSRYAKTNGITFKVPKFQNDSLPPYVPTTEEITALISDAGLKYSLILNVLKDSGLRPIELHNLTSKCFDKQKNILRIASAKNGKPRILKLKESTAKMLLAHIQKNNFAKNEKMFPNPKTMQNVFRKTRRRTAKKLQRPELDKITLYSFRHYYASKLYQHTRDYLLVKNKLGHRRIEQTITYIHTIIDGFDENDFVTATAETVADACKLLEDGYQKIEEFNGIHIYRKRK